MLPSPTYQKKIKKIRMLPSLLAKKKECYLLKNYKQMRGYWLTAGKHNREVEQCKP